MISIFTGLREFVTEVSGTLLDIILPRRCVLCGTITGSGEGDICRSCRERLLSTTHDKGGEWKPFASQSSPGSQNRFSGERNAVISGGPYQGDLRRLIIAFKFQGHKSIGRFLATMLGRSVGRRKGAGPGLIVPVPLSEKRLAQRGFNQSAVLARELAVHSGLAVLENALERTRETGFQTSLDRSGRWKNVRAAFRITDPQSVKGRNVLLVDDLYTTGATVANCAEALLGAGAENIYVAVAAIAPLHGDGGGKRKMEVRDGII